MIVGKLGLYGRDGGSSMVKHLGLLMALIVILVGI